MQRNIDSLMLRLTQEVQEGEKKEEEKEKEKKKEVEPNFQLLENPARVMPAQLKVLTMPETCRYQPFKPVNHQAAVTQGPSESREKEPSVLSMFRCLF